MRIISITSSLHPSLGPVTYYGHACSMLLHLHDCITYIYEGSQVVREHLEHGSCGQIQVQGNKTMLFFYKILKYLLDATSVVMQVYTLVVVGGGIAPDLPPLKVLHLTLPPHQKSLRPHPNIIYLYIYIIPYQLFFLTA